MAGAVKRKTDLATRSPKTQGHVGEKTMGIVGGGAIKKRRGSEGGSRRSEAGEMTRRHRAAVGAAGEHPRTDTANRKNRGGLK